MTRLSKLALVGCLAFWASGVVFGTRYANNYSDTPGRSAPPVEQWPRHTALQLPVKGSTVLIAIHPQCPCSSASVAELRNAIERSGEHPMVYALIYQPSGQGTGWADTPVIRAARGVPGLRIVIDQDGQEIERFHARVSGEVFLYDASGCLRFKGGVTARRGHPGPSQGADALTALLRNANLPYAAWPVFGCSLRNEPAEATK